MIQSALSRRWGRQPIGIAGERSLACLAPLPKAVIGIREKLYFQMKPFFYIITADASVRHGLDFSVTVQGKLGMWDPC